MELEKYCNKLFPFYVKLNENNVITEVGSSLLKLYPEIIESKYSDYFSIIRPKFLADDIYNVKLQKQLILIKFFENDLIFRGQLMQMESAVYFLGSPWVDKSEKLVELGLYGSDFAIHDQLNDLLLAVKQQEIQTDDIRGLVKNLEKQKRRINLEKQKLEQLNINLLSSNSKLEYQTKQLQEFAYISSHNLRAPAGNIMALLDFYNSEPSPENLKLFLEKLDVVSLDLLDTIQELANVVQIKSEISEDFSSINLAKLIEKASDSLSQEISNKTASISLQLNGISSIKSSKTYMDSIILNLLSNALKYAHKERKPIIQFAADQNDRYFILSVQDNGSGIDLKKHGKKVFGLRRTFHRNTNGNGIGLFITKAQVEAMDGNISIESEPNIGTTFTIRLPKKVIIE